MVLSAPEAGADTRTRFEPFSQVQRRLLLGREDAGAFERDVDVLPGQLGRVALGGDADRAVADVDRVAVDRHRAGKAAVHQS